MFTLKITEQNRLSACHCSAVTVDTGAHLCHRHQGRGRAQSAAPRVPPPPRRGHAVLPPLPAIAQLPLFRNVA